MISEFNAIASRSSSIDAFSPDDLDNLLPQSLVATICGFEDVETDGKTVSAVSQMKSANEKCEAERKRVERLAASAKAAEEQETRVLAHIEKQDGLVEFHETSGYPDPELSRRLVALFFQA